MDVKRLPDFDNISFCYDFFKIFVFGTKLEKAQKHFLSLVPDSASVLVIGGGTGKLLIDIIKNRNPRTITYLEISDKMLQAAKRRLNWYQNRNRLNQKNVDFRLGSVDALNAMEKFDVIFTPFVLDVIDEQDLFDFMKKIDFHLLSQGLWFFSDFKNPDAAGLSTAIHKLLLKGMFFFFKVTTNLKVNKLADFDAYFLRLNYHAIRSRLFQNGFIQSKVWKRN